MNFKKTAYLIVSSVLMLTACVPEPDKVKEKTAPEPVPEVKITERTVFENNLSVYGDKAGIVGVYDVPEMLVLCKVDSCAAKDVSKAMVENYALLEEELNATGAEINGAVGMITYNNSTTNFVFENILCIKRIPAVQPKTCKIVVLEASKMLVFNFYGSYQNLFSAYDKIRKYSEKNDLLQSGPMREFYITDPAKEKNPEKWLTRILVPVISMKEK